MEERIERMERESEKRERDERKNNIIIKGHKFGEEDLRKQAESFLAANLKVKVGIKYAQRLIRGIDKKGSGAILVKLQKWEDKKTIMERKKDLDKGIYIEDDLTRKEREI